MTEPLPSKVTLLPTVSVVVEALMLAVGPSGVTLTVLLLLDAWPRLSVTVSCTVKLPLLLPSVATVAVGALVDVLNEAKPLLVLLVIVHR